MDARKRAAARLANGEDEEGEEEVAEEAAEEAEEGEEAWGEEEEAAAEELSSQPCQPLEVLYGAPAIRRWLRARRARAGGSASSAVRAEHGAGCACFASKRELIGHLTADHAIEPKRCSARDEALRERLDRCALRGSDALVQRW